MKKYLNRNMAITLVLAFNVPLFSFAQQVKLKDLTEDSKANYFFANIQNVEFLSYPLFERALFINAILIYDSEATPADYFEGTDEVLSSILISIRPDGDYYTESKLYKLEGLENPKILAIQEGVFPDVIVEVEYGKKNKRKTERVRLTSE
ncbi:hypothetical protein SAMN04488519_105294 [Algoriphagus ornithinivorans]|uniref:Uncharacterized protein n=1 Tax=Algoriphagus ornithinivorans TaxID=226506 RepID=A0A1I5GB13_9BACT|nr:hypothetical protein [Algoriphagus ornithinivorans]SFO33180.1 hypothetical protein SAMN04488519_105294 [Algoriphagus ornithinivorans]